MTTESEDFRRSSQSHLKQNSTLVKMFMIAALGLLAVYAFLFVILRLQDYSLLIGTAGLFLVLGLVMYVTRNLDWYARDRV